VGRTPVGFALVPVTVAEQKGLEPEPAAAQVIDGIRAGAAEVADGLIGGIGDINAVSSPARRSRAMVRASRWSVL